MVPAGSDRVSRVRPYSGTRQGRDRSFAYGTFALCGGSFQTLPLPRSFVTPPPQCSAVKPSPTTPTRLELHLITPDRFGLFPVRSPLLRESRFLSLRLGTKMYQFPSCVSACPMCSGTGTRALPRVGSPIRKSPGRRLFSTSPRLIAAGHVLHRLLAPRHPPMALNILTERTSLPLCSFQGSRRRTGTCRERASSCGQRRRGRRNLDDLRDTETGSFKTEQCEAVRTRLGRTETGTRVVDIEFLEDGHPLRGKARRPHRAALRRPCSRR